MNLLVELLFISSLVTLTYQDLKEQQVDLWLLVAGMLLGGTMHFMHQNTVVFWASIRLNLGFVLFIFGILWAYAALKIKKSIFEVFGLGDLLFFMLLAVSLPLLAFLMIFIFSLLFSLLIYIGLKERFDAHKIPLAGLQSLFFVLALLSSKFISTINLFEI